MNTERVKLKDVTLMWAKLDEVDEMSGKYQVDLANLSSEHVEAIGSLGLEVRNKEGKGFYITAKSTKPIEALAADGSILKQKIGNGSKANILLGAYDWNYKNKKGKSASIAKMIVTHVETFKGDDVDSDDDLL
jgi:hypothetical protein